MKKLILDENEALGVKTQRKLVLDESQELDEKLPKDLARVYRHEQDHINPNTLDGRFGTYDSFNGDDLDNPAIGSKLYKKTALPYKDLRSSNKPTHTKYDYEKSEYEPVSVDEALEYVREYGPGDLRIIYDGQLIKYDFNSLGYYQSSYAVADYGDGEYSYYTYDDRAYDDSRRIPLETILKRAEKIYIADEVKADTNLHKERERNPESRFFSQLDDVANSEQHWANIYVTGRDLSNRQTRGGGSPLPFVFDKLHDDPNDIAAKGAVKDRKAFLRNLPAEKSMREPFRKYFNLKADIEASAKEVDNANKKLDNAKLGTPRAQEYKAKMRKLKKELMQLEMYLEDEDVLTAEGIARAEAEYNEYNDKFNNVKSELNSLLRRNESLDEALLNEKLPRDLAKAYRNEINSVGFEPSRSYGNIDYDSSNYGTGSSWKGTHRGSGMNVSDIMNPAPQAEYDFQNSEYKPITKEEAEEYINRGQANNLRIIYDGQLVTYENDDLNANGVKPVYYAVFHNELDDDGNIKHPEEKELFTNEEGRTFESTRSLPLDIILDRADNIYWTDENEHKLDPEKQEIQRSNPESRYFSAKADIQNDARAGKYGAKRDTQYWGVNTIITNDDRHDLLSRTRTHSGDMNSYELTAYTNKDADFHKDNLEHQKDKLKKIQDEMKWLEEKGQTDSPAYDNLAYAINRQANRVKRVEASYQDALEAEKVTINKIKDRKAYDRYYASRKDLQGKFKNFFNLKRNYDAVNNNLEIANNHLKTLNTKGTETEQEYKSQINTYKQRLKEYQKKIMQLEMYLEDEAENRPQVIADAEKVAKEYNDALININNEIKALFNKKNEGLFEELLDEKVPSDLANIYKQGLYDETGVYKDSYGNIDGATPYNKHRHTGIAANDVGLSISPVEYDFENAEYREVTPDEAKKIYEKHPEQLRVIFDGQLVKYNRNGGPSITAANGFSGNDELYSYDNNVARILSSELPIDVVLDRATKIYWTDEKPIDDTKYSIRRDNPESRYFRTEKTLKDVYGDVNAWGGSFWPSNKEAYNTGFKGDERRGSWALNDYVDSNSNKGLQDSVNILTGQIKDAEAELDDWLEKLEELSVEATWYDEDGNEVPFEDHNELTDTPKFDDMQLKFDWDETFEEYRNCGIYLNKLRRTRQKYADRIKENEREMRKIKNSYKDMKANRRYFHSQTNLQKPFVDFFNLKRAYQDTVKELNRGKAALDDVKANGSEKAKYFRNEIIRYQNSLKDLQKQIMKYQMYLDDEVEQQPEEIAKREEEVKQMAAKINEIDNNLKSLMRKNAKKEALEESIQLKEELSPEEVQMEINTVISNLIQSKWQAIDGLNGSIAVMQGLDRPDITAVLSEMINDNYIHIGQLEKLLELNNANASQIDAGKEDVENNLEDTNHLEDIEIEEPEEDLIMRKELK